MRHNRRAVMAERYKIYLKKNIFNGRYFVRNLQIAICIVAVAALVTGTIVLIHSDEERDTVTVTVGASVKEALFGNSAQEESAAKVTDTEEVTTAVTEEAVTEVAFAQTKTAADYIEMSSQFAEKQAAKSEFDGKCIANVEETLNIRMNPSSDAEFVGSMNSGAIAIVQGTEGEWTKIKSGDVEGYVLTDYILTGESAEQYAKDYVTLLGTVLEDGVNVRSEESITAEIITVLEKDDTITVLEDPKDNKKDKEVKEEIPDNADALRSTGNSTQAVSSEQITEGQSTETNTAEQTTEVKTEEITTQQNLTEKKEVERDTKEEDTESDITWLPIMLEDGQTGYVSADLVDVDKLYAIAVSAEELERQEEERLAAEKAATEEAARQAAVANSSNSNSGGGNGSEDSYKGETTTPVTATESGEYIGTFTITAYCGCKKCSAGHNKTASGTTPTEGRTIAADTSVLPFGTQVVIDGIVYTVEDRGSGVNGNHIDIFFATHKRALAFGTKTMKVYKY